MICEPIFNKLKVGEHIMWDDRCQAAFDKIKEVLSSSPVLSPPVAGLPLSLYLIVTDTAMGAMLAQTVDKEDRAIYYLSKKFLEYESKYTALEKTCLALVWATKKLRHYMLSYSHAIVCRTKVFTSLYKCVDDGEESGQPWYASIVRFKEAGEYPANLDTRGKRALRMLSAQFVKTNDGQLYKKTKTGVLLRCVDKTTSEKVMEEVHDGECGSHMNSHMLVRKIMRRQTAVILEKYRIKHHKSSPYRPQTSGAVEAANKTVATILRKMSDNYKEWPEKIPFALWGYRTSIRTATGATPYYIVYEMEAVQPVELEVPSLRILLESHVPEADWVQARYDSLVLLDERRLNALYHVQLYQKRIERAFNKKVKPRGINEGDLVLKSVRALLPVNPRGKFKPNWAGPYLVKKILTGGAVRLTYLDGNDFSNPTNLDQLKKYYP
ncbi:uncharacterized protein LOC141630651 [Silene latifolia]|uniref:uncharacterized protein LOC141630651 n=1 Tax=Silene latifolia TaxID=37657 RepID=UPI003D7898A2